MWNPAATEVFGYLPEEALGLSVEEIVPERLKGRHRGGLSRYNDTGHGPYIDSYTVLNLPAVRKGGEEIQVELTLTPLAPPSGTEGRFVLAIVRDVTERKEAEERLRQTEARYRTLVERMPAVSYLQEIGGAESAMYMSPQIENLTGYSVDECKDPDLRWRMVHPDDRERLQAGDESPVEPGEVVVTEYRVVRPDGRTVWVRNEAVVVEDETRGVRYWQGFMVDITERKRAEEEKARWARHAALRADVGAIFTQGGPLRSVLQRCTECVVHHLNAAFARVWTLNEEENVLELRASAGMYTHLDGPHGRVPLGKFKIGLIAEEGKPYLINDVLGDPRIADKEWAEREGMKAFAGNPLVVEGRVVGVVAMFARQPLKEDTIEALASVADVLAQGIERKQAEEALKSSEDFFRALYEDVHHPIFLLDGGLNFVDVNPNACEFYGYSREEFKEMNVTDLALPEDLAKQREHADKMLQRGEVIIPELRHRKKSGEIVTITADADKIVRSGEDLYVSKITDITERKRAEEEIQKLNEELEDRVAERTARLENALASLNERERRLRESKERYQAVVEQAGEGIFLFDPRTKRILEANPAFREMFGYAAEEVDGMTLYDLIPQDAEGVDRNVERALQQRYLLVGEREYSRKDGSKIDVEVSGGVIFYGGEEVVCSVVRDITERRRAEKALRASEARFRTLVEQSPLSIQILSPDGRTLQVNRAWEELWGTNLEGIAGYNLLEDQQLVDKGAMPYILRGFAGEPAAIPPIAYVPDETIPDLSSIEEPMRWVRAFIYPIKDDSGNVIEVVLVHEDVTEHHRAEKALKEGEERYRAVVEQAAEGIVLVDVETKCILEANAVYENLLGYAPEEMLALTLYDVVPYARESMDCYVEQVLEKRIYVSGERSHLRKDGTLVDVEVSASVISYGGREAICVVIRDITERKRAKEALQKVREAERQRIARDLHDGALQDLTYALAEAQIVRMLSEDPSLDERLDQEIEALRRTERGLREAVYDLRPMGIHDRALPELLESLIEESRRMSPGCDIRLEVEEGFTSAPLGEGGTELLRIVQEALTNARKHAEAQHILVALKTGGDRLVAEVSDDGRGFDPGPTRVGVGLQSMRERTAALGGELEVGSEPGKGTRIRFHAPLRNFGEGSRAR